MKNNSYLINEPSPHSYSFKDENLLLESKKEEEHKNLFQESKSKKSRIFNFINNFWNRLVAYPTNFSQSANSKIINILETEKVILADNKIKSVLAKILGLPIDSKSLQKAVANTNKIFHEDYPFDFILEYQGKRLGIMLLDVCRDLNNKEEIVYKFNPEIKSFKGLF
ncbi:hypothetical protein [Salegentibacter holothuriorum]|nr:hypothetical protein [Salegentibacter holothuriorum]